MHQQGEKKSFPTLQRDGGPSLPRVHEGGVGDLLSDVLILIERERAAQAHVHDDAHGPHVQRAVVAVAADHLWRQIRRRAHDRAAERLLADDTGEAKVAELYLQHTNSFLKKKGEGTGAANETPQAVTKPDLRERVGRGQQHILRLQVAVGDVFEVQVPQSLQDL